MKIGYIIYNEMTALDFIGIYDPLSRLKTMGYLPDLSWEVCAYQSNIADNTGLHFAPHCVGETLQHYDMIVVPGGYGSRKLIHNLNFMNWIRTAKDCPLKVSVCTGALILGAAGFLTGKKATTHPTAFHLLEQYCEVVATQRVVDEGEVITARGVTASIDIGLYICGKFAGVEAQERIRTQMDYGFI